MQHGEAAFQHAVEMIRCAYINTENMNKMGVQFIPLVKAELNEALEALGEPKMEL